MNRIEHICNEPGATSRCSITFACTALPPCFASKTHQHDKALLLAVSYAKRHFIVNESDSIPGRKSRPWNNFVGPRSGSVCLAQTSRRQNSHPLSSARLREPKLECHTCRSFDGDLLILKNGVWQIASRSKAAVHCSHSILWKNNGKGTGRGERVESRGESQTLITGKARVDRR